MNEYYEVIPTPEEDQTLQVGDRVELTWDLYQTGDWLIALQISKIEQAFEADGRLKLLAYSYDEQAMTLMIRCEVLTAGQQAKGLPLAASVAPVVVVLAVSIAAIVGIVTGAIWGILYPQSRRDKVFRIRMQDLADDPETPPSVQKEIEDAIEDAGGVPGPNPFVAASGAVVVLGIAILAVVLLGD